MSSQIVQLQNPNPMLNKKLMPNQAKVNLEEKLDNIMDKQGILGKTWNGLKELTTLGVSVSDCESMLDKYNNGEISFEEAITYLDEFDAKQENMSGVLSNILTGIGAIATATVTNGVGVSVSFKNAFKTGAPIGSALKTTIGILDRSTNNVEDDALNFKNVAKDAISGAMTGATSAVSSGVSKGIKEGKVAKSIINGAKCGAICGSMSGASSYMTDVAFQDKEFDSKDLITNTLTSAAVSATVGGTMGGLMYGGANLSNQIGQNAVSHTLSVGEAVAKDSTTSSARKILGNKLRHAIS